MSVAAIQVAQVTDVLGRSWRRLSKSDQATAPLCSHTRIARNTLGDSFMARCLEKSVYVDRYELGLCAPHFAILLEV